MYLVLILIKITHYFASNTWGVFFTVHKDDDDEISNKFNFLSRCNYINYFASNTGGGFFTVHKDDDDEINNKFNFLSR